MARAGLLHVPRDEPRQAHAGRALRLDLEPQLRGPSGLQGPHTPRVARDGSGRRHRGSLRRCSRVALILSACHSLTPVSVAAMPTMPPAIMMAAVPAIVAAMPPYLRHALIRHRMLDSDVG